eukprot:2836862-Rhodomonas_salina.2
MFLRNRTQINPPPSSEPCCVRQYLRFAERGCPRTRSGPSRTLETGRGDGRRPSQQASGSRWWVGGATFKTSEKEREGEGANVRERVSARATEHRECARAPTHKQSSPSST